MFGFLDHRFGALSEGFDWAAKVKIPPGTASRVYGVRRANLRVLLQPINKVVLLQMKKFSGGSDDFSAIDFPLPTNIIGKSSVWPRQQEDCGQTTFLPQPTAHQPS